MPSTLRAEQGAVSSRGAMEGGGPIVEEKVVAGIGERIAVYSPRSSVILLPIEAHAQVDRVKKLLLSMTIGTADAAALSNMLGVQVRILDYFEFTGLTGKTEIRKEAAAVEVARIEPSSPAVQQEDSEPFEQSRIGRKRVRPTRVARNGNNGEVVVSCNGHRLADSHVPCVFEEMRMPPPPNREEIANGHAKSPSVTEEFARLQDSVPPSKDASDRISELERDLALASEALSRANAVEDQLNIRASKAESTLKQAESRIEHLLSQLADVEKAKRQLETQWTTAEAVRVRQTEEIRELQRAVKASRALIADLRNTIEELEGGMAEQAADAAPKLAEKGISQQSHRNGEARSAEVEKRPPFKAGPAINGFYFGEVQPSPRDDGPPPGALIVNDKRIFSIFPLRWKLFDLLLREFASDIDIDCFREANFHSDYSPALGGLRFRSRQSGEKRLFRIKTQLTRKALEAYVDTAREGPIGSLWEDASRLAPLFPNGYGLRLFDDDAREGGVPIMRPQAIALRNECIKHFVVHDGRSFEKLVRLRRTDLFVEGQEGEVGMTIAFDARSRDVHGLRSTVPDRLRKTFQDYLKMLDVQYAELRTSHASMPAPQSLALFPSANWGELVQDPVDSD